MHIIHLPQTDSTQLYAKRWLDEHPEAKWAAVVADYQTSGQGQWGRAWESLLGNVHVTYIVPLPANRLMGLRMVEVLHHVLPAYPLHVKWPNDVFLNGKKCGGVLCEAYGSHTLIGLGLNVSCAPEGRTCLSDFAPVHGDSLELAQTIGHHLMEWDLTHERAWALPPLLYQNTWIDYTPPVGDVFDVYVLTLALNGALNVVGKDGGAMLLHSGRLGAEGART